MLAWSRVRFVRFAEREDQATTLRLLAECFEALGGVPAVVLADRMGCLKGGVVANVVVPAPGYVAFARHYGFRPDFCEAADPESKGVVENLVGYAKRDLVVGCGPFGDVRLGERQRPSPGATRSTAGSTARPAPCPTSASRPSARCCGRCPRCDRPSGRSTSRTVDHLRTVRFGSARYSVPGAFIGRRVEVSLDGPELVIRHAGSEIARHPLVAPGEMSLLDEHYGRPARKPARALRPRTPAELAFLGLGPVAEAFLRQAAAAGATRLPVELGLIADLERAYGRVLLVAALERALAHRRFRAADVRAILAAGAGVQRLTPAGEALMVSLPAVPVRSLAAYAIEPVR